MIEQSPKDHPENINRFERFSELAGLQEPDPRTRIEALQNMEADKFLDILAVSNGLLRGEDKFQRWSGESASVNVSGLVMGVDMQPPEQSHELFRSFYKKFTSEVAPNEHDLQKSAIEMYFAIIGTHMFPDGNGRLARAAYYLIKYGKLPKDQSEILERQKGIAQAAQAVNRGAVKELFDREGFQYDYLNDVAADDTQAEGDVGFVDGGLTQQTKYVAARRVMLQNGEWSDQPPSTLKLKDWPEAKKKQFDDEYRNVREEWLAAYIDTAGAYAPGLAGLIEANANDKPKVSDS
jgi:hypothetical protein